jgi:HAMP domain-containing protein
MRLSFAPNLLTRVMLLVTIGLLLIFGGFALLGLQAVSESTERTLQERLLITQITAGRVDDLLQQKIVALEAVAGEDSVDPESENPEAFGPTLRVLGRQLGDFSNYVALINGKGKVVWTEPYIPRLIGSDLSSNRYVANALSTGQPTISGFFSVSEMEPTAAILVPRRKPGDSVNALVYAAVNLRHPSITRLLSRLEIGKTGYAEIVDEDGFPLVSTWAEQPWQKCRYSDRFAALIRERQTTVGRCHDCHTASTDRRQGVMAFAALATAPWGVVVQQGEQEAFTNTKTLEQRLFFFGAVAFLMTLLIAWLLTRSVVSPIQALTAACQRIASGDLDQPIPSFGKDEVGVLARSFNAMRERLKSSLEEIRGWNLELERRVGQRTKELAEA